MKLRVVGLAVGTALALSACGGKSDESEAAKTPPAEGRAAATTGGAEPGTATTPEQAGVFGKLFNDGKPMPLNLSSVHPNGAALTLNSIQVKPTETVVNFTVTNGHTSGIALASAVKSTYLEADGRQFHLVPPTDNTWLHVESGETMTGDLVFIGAVPRTDRLRLIFNARSGSDSDGAAVPKFTFDIPVQGSAYSDDGSKKKPV